MTTRLQSTRLLQSIRLRRARRGAAMVEAAVAIPFFITIFASMLYVATLYGEKQRTLREAKEQAWVHAMSNCTESGNTTTSTDGSDPMSDMMSTSPPDPAPGVSNDGSIGQYSGAANGSETLTNWGTAEATVTGRVQADRIVGGFTNNLKTTTRMQCNEVPVDGNVSGVLHMAWRLIKFW